MIPDSIKDSLDSQKKILEILKKYGEKHKDPIAILTHHTMTITILTRQLLDFYLTRPGMDLSKKEAVKEEIINLIKNSLEENFPSPWERF